MIKGFREFIVRGNVLDLAVAVVIGAAFATVVKGFTDGLVQPLIKEVMGGGVTGGKIELSADNFIDLSLVINAIITFLITAAVVYFVFVLPMDKYRERRAARAGDPAPEEESELDVLKQIRDRLSSPSE